MSVYFLYFKILLILQKKIESEFSYLFITNQINEESYFSLKPPEDSMALHLHMLYVVETNIPETLLSSALGQPNVIEICSLYEELMYLHQGIRQK